jgi:hypothetical protein
MDEKERRKERKGTKKKISARARFSALVQTGSPNLLYNGPPPSI